jgi:ribosomal protein L11 methylase PrmA
MYVSVNGSGYIWTAFVHLHARAQKYYADKIVKPPGRGMSNRAFLGLLDQLESAISKLKWKPQASEWSNYYGESGYSHEAFEAKKKLLERFIDGASPQVVWDLGSNTGMLSRIASDKGIITVAFDSDPSAVEKNYLECLMRKDDHLLPLFVDLTNPSPNLGWANSERTSLAERGPVDLVMALALIHHLAISNNVPLENIAEFLAGIAKCLVIEFVPKDDQQVKKLLSTRIDIFPDYNSDTFEYVFGGFFEIMESCQIAGSHRVLYLMKKKEPNQ